MPDINEEYNTDTDSDNDKKIVVFSDVWDFKNIELHADLSGNWTNLSQEMLQSFGCFGRKERADKSSALNLNAYFNKHRYKRIAIYLS